MLHGGGGGWGGLMVNGAGRRIQIGVWAYLEKGWEMVSAFKMVMEMRMVVT